MKNSIPRRQFLQAGGLALGAVGASYFTFLNAQQPNSTERVRFGIIGVGMEGSGLQDGDRTAWCGVRRGGRSL